DYFSPLLKAHMLTRQRHMRNAPFRFFPKDWFHFFASCGWRSRQIRYLGEVSVQLGREIPKPWWTSLLFWLPRARQRRDAFPRLAGYVLLERGGANSGVGLESTL